MNCFQFKVVKVCSYTQSNQLSPCTTFDFEQVLVPVKTFNNCAYDYVLLTKAETDLLMTNSSTFTLSASEGAILGGAILAVWAMAFAFKAVIKALNSGDPEN